MKKDRKVEFRKELESLLNQCSKENGSDTPDYILAEFLSDCLDNWDRCTRERDAWNDSQQPRR